VRGFRRGTTEGGGEKRPLPKGEAGLPLGKGGFERMCVNESKTYFNKYFTITVMDMLLPNYDFKQRVIYDAFR